MLPDMDTTTHVSVARSSVGHGVLPRPAAWVVTILGAFLAGVLTSFGQAVPGLSTLSNSAGPWFLVAVGLLLVVRPRPSWGVPLGVGLLVLMHVGYTVATNLRGYADFLSVTNPWVLLAVPAGALAGACAVALRGIGAPAVRPAWRGVAFGVGTGVLASEGISALLTVADTTGTTTWIVEIGAGVAVLVAGMLVARTAAVRVLTLATAVVGTAVALGAYALLLR